ncbi:hypothetical protein QUF88_14245 [Bacillus sp. DX1.1]|uniref:hypothetical protein n=2 Tax=unclassified Bacillus (in: firmicutes) TaxID=185979 RepID=UPI002570C887|nr:hypothetical protein [Bacillus sp. DX3.1]MDM5154937.1 hypothetical protein [Bacillus sp. DX1.1]WJE83802.1 hypothetical protein QRE67_11740 [Bacillus sp. DX3.1]
MKEGIRMEKRIIRIKLKKSVITSFRWFLAIMFIIYGIAKIYPGQFSTGDFIFDSTKDSPMKLAWYFFGYSNFYNLFIAFGELTAALLLLIPRTATVGNIIYLPITVNITVLNYCFDIPALPISIMLTSLSILLLLLEYSKLKRVFFENGVVDKQRDTEERWMNVR